MSTDNTAPVVTWGVNDDSSLYPITSWPTVEAAKAHAAQLAAAKGDDA